jgi:beta-lactamase regulating signal transducer with metallopeptidase domain
MGFSIPTTTQPHTPISSAERAQRVAEWRAHHPEAVSATDRQARMAEFRERVHRERRIMTAVGVAWIAGSVLIVFIVGLRAFCLRRRIRKLPFVTAPEFLSLVNSCAADMGLRRAIQVRMAPDDECPAPAVTALFKPVIILPQTMIESWEADELKPILLHELAHVRRRDISINWLQIGLQTLYFFHPLVWLANWKIRTLREEAADDLSIAKMGGLRHLYSASLLRAIELANTARPAWGAVALAERKSDLVKRLRRVLRPEYRAPQETRLKIVAKVFVMGGLCLLLSGMVPVQPQHHQFGGCAGRSGMCHGGKTASGKCAAAKPAAADPTS